MNQNQEMQMSEAMPANVFLILSGGFQDAYTYFCRGKVFANGQTGNVILFGAGLADRQWDRALRYLAPVLAFTLGIYVVEMIREKLKDSQNHIHWRQVVLLVEIVAMFVVGFMPQSLNVPANIIISFVCAMQVEAFRKLEGSAYASTMCIGNLRSATALLFNYRHTHSKTALGKSLKYYGVILIFAAGAVLGVKLSEIYQEETIWVSCIFLFVSFLIMFIHGREKDEAGQQ